MWVCRALVPGEPSEELLPDFAQDDLASTEDIEVQAVFSTRTRVSTPRRTGTGPKSSI